MRADILLVFTLIGLLAACEKPPVTVIRDETPRPVRLHRVSAAASVSRLNYVARTEAVQTVDLSFQVGGTLEHFPIREGQFLGKGDLIASLELVDFERAAEQAQVQLRLATQDLRRKRALFQQEGVSEAVIDDAVATFNLRRLALEAAREHLKDARLEAPFDAYVSRRFVDNFVNVRPGEPIVRLQDLTEIYIKVNVPEDLLATVQRDAVERVQVRFPFDPTRSFDIEYRENANEADPVTQTYEITFAMPRPQGINLLPGMTGTVEVVMRDASALISIPISALVPDNRGGFQVWVYVPATGRVAAKPVTTGEPHANEVIITGGLTGGEEILAAGALHAFDGMPVRPLNRSP